ncbi:MULTISPECIES: hypothetical protein [Rhodococcus]|uniref:hypothetical protein n=1 Tax=Rhodococcus TaxID=1827 RepID=UPI001E48F023|nr:MULTISPECIES: hypothetical protein [Rhodococcus]MCD2106220.1 hypothetical protein [Rhodococcus qingshengii]MCZ4524644.1 hypothetical protein [Rhodococcus erythropolis]MDV8008037.1 hypothetical protein [Rhodococcus sp. IEGM 1318]MDZ7911483.1 hypothetical protein [Rhodococcus sp. (in: high G+C Gram-positive bacteria)]
MRSITGFREAHETVKTEFDWYQAFFALGSRSSKAPGARLDDVGSGILKTMWWMVGLIVLAALVLASVVVGFVFRRPIAEDKSAVLAFDDATSQPQRD